METYGIDFISPNSNETLTKLSKKDLKNLLWEIEKYRLQYRQQLGLPAKVTFGYEIEYNGLSVDKSNDLLRQYIKNEAWYAKQDGTVDSEIVSPILRDTQTSWQELKEVCKILKKEKVSATHCSASHVHFGSQIIGENMEHWSNMLKLWAIFEDIIVRFSRSERILETRYQKAPTIEYISYEIHQVIKKLERDPEFLNLKFDRRSSTLNLNNVRNGKYDGSKNTIEVRCPYGTINQVIWQNNTNFFGKLFEYATSPSFDKELVDKLYQKEQTEHFYYCEIFLVKSLILADLIFDNNLDKIYFLKQYINSFAFPGETDISRLSLIQK